MTTTTTTTTWEQRVSTRSSRDKRSRKRLQRGHPRDDSTRPGEESAAMRSQSRRSAARELQVVCVGVGSARSEHAGKKCVRFGGAAPGKSLGWERMHASTMPCDERSGGSRLSSLLCARRQSRPAVLAGGERTSTRAERPCLSRRRPPVPMRKEKDKPRARIPQENHSSEVPAQTSRAVSPRDKYLFTPSLSRVISHTRASQSQGRNAPRSPIAHSTRSPAARSLEMDCFVTSA